MEFNYNEQMLNYYPEVIKAIREFQKMIETESLQVEEMHEALTKALENAYIITADEARISQWERYLGIVPLPQGDDDLELWLADRKETILARLYNTQKLNSTSIAEVVSIFTGGTAVSYFKDGVINVLIRPPRVNKQYKFENVEQELNKMIPAHLILNVRRDYYDWLSVKSKYSTWGDVNADHTNWEEVLLASTLA